MVRNIYKNRKTAPKLFVEIIPTMFLFLFFSCSSYFDFTQAHSEIHIYDLFEFERWNTQTGEILDVIPEVKQTSIGLFMQVPPTITRDQCVVIYPDSSGLEMSLKIKSDYQEDSTRIRIVHSGITNDSALSLVFVLPVEAHNETYQYGIGIDECQKLIDRGLVSKNVVFIQPEYIKTPWYGNHASNREIRQQDYTLEVINLIKTKYADIDKKLKVFLLGFSKSGWGAMNMLMNHPASIDGILIWDAPLATGWNEHWGMQEAFGNAAHFDKNYSFLRENGIPYEALKSKTIIIGGYDYFEKLSRDFLTRLDQKEIAYVHDNGLRYPHQWDKRWIQALLLHENMAVKTE